MKPKIMIVDDEHIFREYLKQLISDYDKEFEICCEAKNGQDAFQNAIKYRPDIALLDINMAKMDGLELAQKLKKSLGNIKIILITGYSEFEYAQKAVKIGVEDYILKPFDRGELISLLLKIKSDIEINKRNKQLNNEKTKLARDKVLNSLITEHYLDKEIIKERLKYFDLIDHGALYLISLLEIDNLEEKTKTLDLRYINNSVKNWIQKVFNLKCKYFIFDGPDNRIVCLFELNNNINKLNVENLLKNICSKIAQNCEYTITVGIGGVYRGYENIKKSYMESYYALQQKFILGDSRIIDYSHYKNKKEDIIYYPGEINELILVGLRLKDWKKVKLQLDYVFNYVKTKNLMIDNIYFIFEGLISVGLSYISEMNANVKDIFNSNFSPYEEIKRMTNIINCKKFIYNYFEHIISYFSDGKISNKKKLLNKAVKIIEEKYPNKSLNVQMIAGEICVSTSYLRKIFKEELNMSVINYITYVRLEMAKKLLIKNKNNIKITEISNMVGYGDPAYFSRRFKEYTGLSPSDYEKNYKGAL